mmetsp:Transcript_104383/g.225211  ORF Transcript_104383/g.225211 Transcript_104383/m.225211 type:complete len:365 (-) Transcript_104383:48-1142(-)
MHAVTQVMFAEKAIPYLRAVEVEDSDGNSSDGDPSVGAEDKVMESELADSIGARTLRMSENSYGAAMALCVQAAVTPKSDHLIQTKALMTLLSCLLGIIAEGFILLTVKWYLTQPAVVAARALYAEYEREYRDPASGLIDVQAFHQDTSLQAEICQLPLANRWFCFVIIAVWTASVAVEVKEAMWFAYAWWHLEHPRHTPITRWNADKKKFIIQACSREMKVVIFVFIIAPKVLIAIFCWWLGCRWLIATPNYHDFILNAVALSFVLDISSLIYTCIIPRDSKMWIAYHVIELPDLVDRTEKNASVQNMKRTRVRNSLIRMAVSWLSALGIPVLYMIFQQAIPGYKWDVAGPCEAYFELIRKLD